MRKGEFRAAELTLRTQAVLQLLSKATQGKKYSLINKSAKELQKLICIHEASAALKMDCFL